MKTNKVNETIQSWGKREGASGRSTPAPSRNIGEVFSENKVGREEKTTANSWRTKTPEPTLKLVNVSVEKAMGSNQNIHISETAHKQMASFLREEVVTNTNTLSSQSSHSTTSSGAAPPAPERNQSYGGKPSDSMQLCSRLCCIATP